MEFTSRELITIICVLFVLKTSFCAVSWDLDTSINTLYEPRFGSSVRLNCTLTGSTCCSPSSSREWWINRGTGFTLLLSNGVSSNAAKYFEDLDLPSNQFNMVIRSFDENDVNFDYKCAHDFDEQSKLLQMSDGLQYIPLSTDIVEVTKDFSEMNQFSYTINITNVYPDPICLCSFGGNDLTPNMTTTTGSNGVLNYAVLSLESVTHECSGELKITCTIGLFTDVEIVKINPCATTLLLSSSSSSAPTTTANQTLTTSSPSLGTDNQIIIVVGVAISVLLFIGVVIILILFFHKRRNANKSVKNRLKGNVLTKGNTEKADSKL